MEECGSAFKILIGKSTGERPSGRPKHRWEDNIRMDLKEICQFEELSWFDSRYGLLESHCECGIEPPGSISHGISYSKNNSTSSRVAALGSTSILARLLFLYLYYFLTQVQGGRMAGTLGHHCHRFLVALIIFIILYSFTVGMVMKPIFKYILG